MDKPCRARIYLKSGMVLDLKFKSLNVEYEGGKVTHLRWTSFEGQQGLLWVNIDAIDAIVEVK